MFKEIFSTITWKQSQITLVGVLINGLLGTLFYVVLARLLGPGSFGILTVSTAALTLIADMVDFGTNTGLVRFVSLNLVTKKEEAYKFLKLSLIIKIAVWLLVLLIGLLFSDHFANLIFQKPELSSPMKLVFIGVGGSLLFSFVASALQAYQKYFLWSFLNIITNLLRLGLIVALFYIGILDVSSSILIYIILPFFGFFLGFLFLPSRDFLLVKNEFTVAKKLFSFNIWVALFTIIAAFSSRLETFIGARLLTSYDIGIYGAVNQLAQAIPQLVSALGVVVTPKFSSFLNSKDMVVYLKKLQFLVLGISALILFILPLAVYLLPLLLGSQYVGSAPSLIILTLAMLIFLISLPIHSSIIFYYGRPDVFVWISLGHLTVVGIGGFLIISSYGLIGISITVFLGNLFNFIAPLIWFLVKYQNTKRKNG